MLTVVVEVQLSRDPDKRRSWPVYVATLRARLRCPTELLVVCPDRAVAGYCAAPITLGLGRPALIPMVLGPELVPVVTDGELPVELVVLSAIAHGGDPERRGILADTINDLAI